MTESGDPITKVVFPRISIVTISYNQKRYLTSAIKSVLDQNYPNLEYVVVDPGSDDGSRELLRSYEPRLARLVLESDEGPADGLNRGFAHVSGDILGFLNADDLLIPASLATVGTYFTKNKDVDLLLGNGWIIDENDARVRHVRAAHFSIRSYFLGGASWLQQSLFFRKSVFDQTGGFNVRNRTSWDGELFLEMLRHGARVGYVHQDLGCFRIHNQSITGNSRMSATQYKDDSERVFSQCFKRKRNISDDILGLFYRVRRLLLDPMNACAAIRKRFRGAL